MKHCILAKFKKEFDLDSHMEDIRSIFDTIKIDGIHFVEYKRNCIARENRYDLLIRIDMDKEALPLYDDCENHHRWKDVYGPSLEKKAIFDYED